jgi:hypothetical protein
MSLTIEELKEKLSKLDEVTLLETLELTSEDIVNRCADLIEEQYETLESQFDDTIPWDND